MNRNKRLIILLSLLSILSLFILYFSLQRTMWGFDIIEGFDEIRHMMRGRAIANQRVDIFHTADNPGELAIYPPGLHIFYANFYMLSGISNAFLVSYLYKFFFFITVILMYFIIGKKISPAVGLGAAFFRVFMFSVSNLPTLNRILIETRSHSMAGTHLSEFSMLFFFFFLITIFKTDFQGSKKYGLSVIFLLPTIVHGIGHVSDFVVFFLGLVVFLLVYSSIYFSSLTKRVFKFSFPKIQFILLFSLSFLSAGLAYTFYFRKIVAGGLNEGLDLSNRLPEFMAAHSFLRLMNLIIPFVTLVLIIVVLYILKKYKTDSKIGNTLMGLRLKRYALYSITLFLVPYMVIVYYINEFPYKYTRGGAVTRIGGYFPVFFDFSSSINIFSITAGLFILALSIIGLYYLLNRTNEEGIILGILFISLYLGASVTKIPMFLQFGQAGSFLFQTLVPFLVGGSIAFFLKFKYSNERNIFKILLKKIICVSKPVIVIFILFLIVFLPVVRVYNYQPPIRDELIYDSPLRFGSDNVMACTPELIKVINSYTEEGERILASPRTYEVLSATTDIGSVDVSYDVYMGNNYNWSITRRAWGNKDYESFFEHYGGQYIVISARDVNEGNRWVRDVELERFENDDRLTKIYENDHGEAIFQYGWS